MRTSLLKTWLSLLLTCGLIGGDVAKVTDYTFAAVADDRPNFPLTRPALDGSGVVRLKSSALKGAGGVRPSKCVPPIGGRQGVRADFQTCKTRYDALSPAGLAQWTVWATEDDMEVFQFFMRTCQVFERRSIMWPPLVMNAWKGWVCKVELFTLPGLMDWPAGLFSQTEIGDAAFDVSACVKVETNQDNVDSDVVLDVGGYYDDGGGVQSYDGHHHFGAGSQAWAQGVVNVPGHNWENGSPWVSVFVYNDTGVIWVDEFSIVQGGVEINENLHFNGGWNDLKKVPVGCRWSFGEASAGIALVYLEDVP